MVQTDMFNEAFLKAVTLWLDPVDLSNDLSRAQAKCSPDTGLWLLNHQIYKSWKEPTDSTSRFMAMFGRSGSGKTVLAAKLIGDVRLIAGKAVVPPVITYFFCHAEEGDKRTATDISATILFQIIRQCSVVQPTLKQAYETAMKYGESKRSDHKSLVSIIREISQSLHSMYVIIDGLDECDHPIQIAQLFLELASDVPSIRVLCSCRPTQPLRDAFRDVSTVSLEPALVKADIDLYLSRELSKLPASDHLRDNALRRLSEASAGMFLYASLSIPALKTAVDPHGISRALDTLPAGINGVYVNLLKRLSLESADRRLLACDVFSWVCCSERLLSWAELEHALSWDIGIGDFTEVRRPFKSVVIDICAPLVEYDEERDVFMVTHHSVTEFLCSAGWQTEMCHDEAQFLVDKARANGSMSQRLIRALMHPEVARNVYLETHQNPLVEYATMYWCSHLSASKREEVLVEQVEGFQSDPHKRLIWIVRYFVLNRDSLPLPRVITLQTMVKKWIQLPPGPGGLCVEDLADIHLALLALDRLGQPDSHNVPISTFERLIYVRDLVRGYSMAGELSRGIELFSKALLSTRETFGAECLSSAWILNSLGLLHDQRHETELAIDVQLQALSIQEKHLPPGHIDQTNTINELGRLYRHLGRYEEAERYHREALSTLRSAFPETDMQVIWTINTLGRCLQKSGRPSEALDLHRQALLVMRESLGEDHAHAIWTLGDIARCQRDLGMLGEAIMTLEEALERRIRVLGSSHLDTLWSMNDLGLLFEETNETCQAGELHLRAYRGQLEALGDHHPFTQWSRQKVEKLGQNVIPELEQKGR